MGKATLEPNTLKQSDISSPQKLVTIELQKNIAHCTTGVDLNQIWGQYTDLGDINLHAQIQVR